MDVFELTKKLVSIASFVDEQNNEAALGEFILNYLRQNSNLEVVKQQVSGQRFNIFTFTRNCQVDNKLQLDYLFVDHIDTVQPKQGWQFDQFIGQEKAGKFYALGANDTKANIAAMLVAALKVINQRIGFLFYIDEEYDFAGMKSFVAEYEDKLTVSEIISVDGDMQIRDACRGLVELDIAVYGKTGHSANPQNGINAITAANQIYIDLGKYVTTLSSANLGSPTLNLAYIIGGLNLGNDNVGKQGNNIADYVQMTIECRTNDQINADKLLAQIYQLAKLNRVEVEILNIRHDLKAWQTPRRDTAKLINVLKSEGLSIEYKDVSRVGYIDVAMLYDAFQTDCYCIGSMGGNAHGVDEWVDIASIYKLESILTKLIN